MKTCTKCGESKPNELFSINKERPDGLHSWCKKCKAPKVYGQTVSRSAAKRTADKMKTIVRYGKDVADVIDSLSTNDDYSRGW